MSLIFRDNQIAVISPGSSTTLIQCGLSDSLLAPASHVPTEVYRDGSNYTFSPTDTVVSPLASGAIVDEAAFHYFLRQVYRSITGKMGIAPALLVLKSPQWTKRQLERLSQHLFEHAGVPGLMFTSNALAISYAFAAKDCIVVDVGLDKTDVSIVHEFETPSNFVYTVPFGGSEITKNLSNSFNLSPEIAEDLKLSGIVEVPIGHREELDVESEEGIVDVAAIVSSGRTREFLEQRERDQNNTADAPKPNAELTENTFTDRNGTNHTVGPARFNACDSLIREISQVIGLLINRSLPKTRASIWQNVIVTGKGTAVPGFKAGLLAQLERIYLVSNTTLSSTGQQFGTPDTTAKQTPNEGDTPSQAPTIIKLAQIADYFPEWKNSESAQAGFLGAQIAAKQSFSGQASYFVSRQDYNDIGPEAVWDL